jgi:phosphotransferase system IIB component
VRSAVAIAAALGGSGNMVSAETCALTRVRVKLLDAALVDEAALRSAGVPAVMRLDEGVLHLIVGAKADEVAAALTSHLHPVAPAVVR